MAIIGGKFRDYVSNQIKRRQRALGQNTFKWNDEGGEVETVGRTSSILKALNTNTPWIRMASSVNITEGDTSLPGNSVLTQIQNQGLFKGFDWIGDSLAKNFVLFSGVNNNMGGIKNSPTGNIGNPLKKAYGFGYDDLGTKNSRGPVPLPGIQSVDFSYKNDGALAQASVKVKCFSPEQFQMIDILFQRPGYTVLLEFGHSVFLDNTGKLQYAGQGKYNYNTIPFQYLYNPDKTSGLYNILDKIEDEKEKWEGNYEAFYAKISKFNWSFNSDGSYDITVNLIGLGDVISSLKMDTTPPEIKIQSQKEFNGDFDKVRQLQKQSPENFSEIKSDKFVNARKKSNSNAFAGEFTSEGLIYIQVNEGSFFSPKIKFYKIGKSNFQYLSNSIGDTPTVQNSLASAFNYELRRCKDVATGFVEFKGGKDDILIGYRSTPYPLMVGTTPITKEVFIKDGILAILTGNNDHDPGTYISFGTLLSIIQQYSNLYSEGIPLLQFDFNFTYMQVDDNYIKKYTGLFSSDPSKVLIPFAQLPANVLGKGNRPLTRPTKNKKDGKPFHEVLRSCPFFTENTNAGRLAYVYLHTDYLSNKYVDSIDSETNTVQTLQFLKDVLKDINSNLTNLNNFKVLHNKETNKIEIVSEVPLGQTTSKNLTTLNTFGVTRTEGSFVKNISLDSELSDNYATQISIGAQNNGSNSQSNSLSFSTYNKGLIDRIIPEKNTDGSIKISSKPKTKPKTTAASLGLYGEFLKNNPGDSDAATTKSRWDKIWTEKTSEIYNSVYFLYNIEQNTLSALKDLNNNISLFINSELTKKGLAPPPFFLPFNLKLTVHGLSGVQIYNSFKIDGKVLPLTYNPNQIELTIKSLSHTVDNNGWVTKIDTFSRPLFEYNESTIKAEEVPIVESTLASEGVSGGGSLVSGGGSLASQGVYGEFLNNTLRGGTVEPGGGVLRNSPLPTSSKGKLSSKEKCNLLYNDPYTFYYPALKTYKFTGDDPTKGITIQGKPLSSFRKVMKDSLGATLPKVGYGVARKLFESVQIIADEALKIDLKITINSHYRGPVYNCSIGGVPKSMHKTGGAMDLGTNNPVELRKLILKLIKEKKIPQGGVGLYNSFVHYDIRGSKARWNKSKFSY